MEKQTQITCRLCGATKLTRREMHGHLMRCHTSEYQACGCNMDRVTTGAPPRKRESPAAQIGRKAQLLPRPAGLRLLGSSRDEAYAREQGFDYIDAETNLYTLEDVQAENWL